MCRTSTLSVVLNVQDGSLQDILLVLVILHSQIARWPKASCEMQVSHVRVRPCCTSRGVEGMACQRELDMAAMDIDVAGHREVVSQMGMLLLAVSL